MAKTTTKPKETPSFEAFDRFRDLASPFAFWTEAARLASHPWFEAASQMMLALAPPPRRSDSRPRNLDDRHP